MSPLFLRRPLLAGWFAVFLVGGATAVPADALTVSLTPSIPSPSPVGTVVTWSAVASGGSGNFWYRFRTRSLRSSLPRRSSAAELQFHVVRDFGPIDTLAWTASEHEGFYDIEVTVQDTQTGESAAAVATYQMTSRVAGTVPVISPTANPLVFLYSAPACPTRGSMSVQFQMPGGPVQSTPAQPCSRGLSMNFYLAGLRAGMVYSVHHSIRTRASIVTGPDLTLTTPAVSLRLPQMMVLQPLAGSTPSGIVLHSTLFGPSYATDLSGNVVWFYSGGITFLTRPESGGRFFGLIVDETGDTSHQIVREFDVAGNTLRETNAARINEQLTALGMHTIGAFHHEARGLPGGGVLVMASTERILTDVQGPGPVDVIGDMILVLDRDLQVVWTWDAFDHLDPHREATLGETCPASGCPPIYLASKANDWLHGNAVQLTADGNLLYSSRQQDWLIKIAYNNGQGDGSVIWRLGKDGDFELNSSDPTAWFSHQHDAQFAPGSLTTVTLYDDGNLRQAVDPNAHSRGQVLQLDERKRTAALVLNSDLGGFSFALGAAQQLPDGNYFFGGGWLPDNSSRLIEVDPSDRLRYEMKVGAPEYRSFRMRDVYTP